MRSPPKLFTFALLSLATPGLAQAPSYLDADGNYVPSYHRGAQQGPGPDAPGDLIRTVTISNQTALSGFGEDRTIGFWANLSGGNAELYQYSMDGVLQATIPTTDVNDSWPGANGKIDAIVTVNAFDDTIAGFDASTGAPLFRVATPTAGPVGAAYDSLRDAYWYADWTTNELIALDATDLHGGIATVVDTFSTAGQATRIAGVARNCLDDTLVTGGRDQGVQVAYNAGSKAVIATWATLGGSVNDPQGCGLSAEAGILTTDFQDPQARVHEGTAGVRPGLSLVPAGPSSVSITVHNFANSETRAIIGWSNASGSDVVKGVLTCLRRPVNNAGTIILSGNPPTGSLIFPTSGSPVTVQAAVLPSKTLSAIADKP